MTQEEAIRQQYVAEMGDAQAKLDHEQHLADMRDTMRAKTKENRCAGAVLHDVFIRVSSVGFARMLS
jgi:hypothetical protein